MPSRADSIGAGDETVADVSTRGHDAEYCCPGVAQGLGVSPPPTPLS